MSKKRQSVRSFPIRGESHRGALPLVFLFGVAIAYFEAAVVVYLRELFYPEGFAFPLRVIPDNLLAVEVSRELCTIIILIAVAGIAARRFWARFGYFIILFGVWDIFYYVWLKVTIGWPESLFDWDVLFLIPLPWIGPVIAPVLIAALMIACGTTIVALSAQGYSFRAPPAAWVLSALATGMILYSFMCDIEAALHQQMPVPYMYSLLIVGLVLYVIAFTFSVVKTLSVPEIARFPSQKE